MILRGNFNPVLVLILFLLGYPVQSKYPSYNKIESILKKTWDEQYPVPFQKIVKKNITGKGTIYYREKKKYYYVYTFLVSMPSQKLVDNQAVPLSEERKIIVKLYYDPSNQEKPYFIRLGELDEETQRPGFIRYVK